MTNNRSTTYRSNCTLKMATITSMERINTKFISVIIPTLNEEINVGRLVKFLYRYGWRYVLDVIVVDGGSTDNTVQVAEAAGAVVVTSPKGRALQMNAGAARAAGEVLYFVHADTHVVESFAEDIFEAIQEDYQAGGYRFRFDSDRWVLKINSYFTRFDTLFVRGGDQTLFVTRALFRSLGGFDERYVIMEEYDFLRRMWKSQRNLFKLIPKEVVVSARKYETNSWLSVQLANLVAVLQFKMGRNPQSIAHLYKKMLNYR
ncbi:TIGR04283 family arsenosugar biosynthesis glycosyltransferase [Runella limosa]|uniref:TIGR04283 family arsenosugar biosynthesis glycosyltransferase n=1 Tax=Runella limosa TaxID=370978 RepID=UPI001E3D423E|nr:TIGR04283 family arsenosugar biosynthesis glycosyltransferase [Runella limosa]